jgi:hypothetical protein
MAENTAVFYHGLTTYLARHLGIPARVLDDVPWQEREQMLYRGEAQLGVVCGLQYVTLWSGESSRALTCSPHR